MISLTITCVVILCVNNIKSSPTSLQNLPYPQLTSFEGSISCDSMIYGENTDDHDFHAWRVNVNTYGDKCKVDTKFISPNKNTSITGFFDADGNLMGKTSIIITDNKNPHFVQIKVNSWYKVKLNCDLKCSSSKRIVKHSRRMLGGDGSTGQKGQKGDIGFGAPGLTGLKGAIGLTGSKGDAGIGLTGSKGDAGIGLTGSKGDAGIGLTGSKGDAGIGLTGSKGDAGIGLTGSKGETGNIGLSGLKGAIGLSGLKGAIGSSGLKGAIGPYGLKGEKGECIYIYEEESPDDAKQKPVRLIQQEALRSDVFSSSKVKSKDNKIITNYDITLNAPQYVAVVILSVVAVVQCWWYNNIQIKMNKILSKLD